LSEGEILEQFFQQQHDLHYIEKIYKKYASANNRDLRLNEFGNALQDCGVNMNLEERALAFKCADLDEDGGLSLEEFRTAVRTRTQLEQWASALPLARLLARCLTLKSGDLDDPICELTKLSEANLDEAVGVFCKGLRRILTEAQAQLKNSFAAMKEQGLSDGHSKFQTFNMSSGNVEDFHLGLAQRIGETL
jgi:Ca2+-binding EF-hand superfamily protein